MAIWIRALRAPGSVVQPPITVMTLCLPVWGGGGWRWVSRGVGCASRGGEGMDAMTAIADFRFGAHVVVVCSLALG